MITAHKIKIFYFGILALFGSYLSSCGTSSDSTSSTAKFSQVAIEGNYLVGLNSCTKGQFDPSQANELLLQNNYLTSLKKDNLKVTANISKTELTVSGPSTYFGATNKSCIVTTTEDLSHRSESSISLRLTSRLCSSTCSIYDCQEEKKIAGSAVRVLGVSVENKSLILTMSENKNACVLDGIHYPPQITYTKQ